MGSKTTTQQDQFVDFNEEAQQFMNEDIQKILMPQLRNLDSVYQQKFANPLTLEKAPIQSEGLSPLAQKLLSQGQSSIRGKQEAENRLLATQLGRSGTGQNSALMNALRRQGNIQSAGATNSLLPGIMQGQVAQDTATQQAIAQRNAQAIQARQQGLSEVQGASQLMQALGQLGVQTGKKVASRTQDTTSDSTQTKRSGILSL